MHENVWVMVGEAERRCFTIIVSRVLCLITVSVSHTYKWQYKNITCLSAVSNHPVSVTYIQITSGNTNRSQVSIQTIQHASTNHTKLPLFHQIWEFLSVLIGTPLRRSWSKTCLTLLVEYRYLRSGAQWSPENFYTWTSTLWPLTTPRMLQETLWPLKLLENHWVARALSHTPLGAYSTPQTAQPMGRTT